MSAPNSDIVTIGQPVTDQLVIADGDESVVLGGGAQDCQDVELGVTVEAGPELDVTVLAGLKGDRGDPGPAGSNAISVIARFPVGGQRLVVSRGGMVQYASANDPRDVGCALFLTLQATNGDQQPVDVLVDGVASDPSWNWTLDTPVFVGSSGMLTQQPFLSEDGAAYVWQVGQPIDAMTLLFRPDAPILLGA